MRRTKYEDHEHAILMQLHEHITGTAVLTTEHGRTLSCTFMLEQYFDGHLLLQCTCDDPMAGWSLYGQHVTGVKGQTADREPFTTHGPYHVASLEWPRVHDHLPSREYRGYVQAGRGASVRTNESFPPE
jgi:hypothetical protein